MFSIGEFSKLTGLTVKTLRYYHEEGLLLPSRVEVDSGYRSYDESKIEIARSITALRELGFTIAETKVVLREHENESTMLGLLQSRKESIQRKIESDRNTLKVLDSIIAMEQAAIDRSSIDESEVKQGEVEPLLVASIHYVGRYEDCGKLFGRIGRRFGRQICGKPMLLCHDQEYRDEANFEVAFPVRKGKTVGDISVYELPGGKTLSLTHHGPYQDISRSYTKLIRSAKQAGFCFQQPTQEIYLKGPGMLLRGNPENYVTEIRLTQT
ncbi:MAG: MerR family transcriptional regulator [Planctomycetota bacterium]